MGFAGYYRKFVKDLAKIAAPLTELMPTPTKKTRGRRKVTPKHTPWAWGDAQHQSFEHLKLALTTPPILAYSDNSKPFELHTDASQAPLGAILYQEQHGLKRVIAYSSRALGKAERNYLAHKLEFLALRWAVTDKFKDTLYGSKFTVYTDNNPLTYVLSLAKLDATGHRWLAALAAFDFSIKDKPGKQNTDADILSRLSHSPSIPEEEEIANEAVHTICGALSGPAIETLCLSAAAVDVLAEPDANDIAEISVRDWRR